MTENDILIAVAESTIKELKNCTRGLRNWYSYTNVFWGVMEKINNEQRDWLIAWIEDNPEYTDNKGNRLKAKKINNPLREHWTWQVVFE